MQAILPVTKVAGNDNANVETRFGLIYGRNATGPTATLTRPDIDGRRAAAARRAL
jgi:hypothetical protein